MTAPREWLDGLKVGDEVAVERWNRDREFRHVTRVTDHFVDVAPYGRFRRKDGRRVGDSSYDCLYLVVPTDADKLAARAKGAQSYLANLSYRELGELPPAVLLMLETAVRAAFKAEADRRERDRLAARPAQDGDA